LWYLGIDSKASFRSSKKEDDDKFVQVNKFDTDVGDGKLLQVQQFSTEDKKK